MTKDKIKLNTNPEESSETGLAEKVKVTPPKRFAVVLINDDYTTMEFVIDVLQRFFSKNPQEAHALMLEIHHKGKAACGVYTYEVAESKAQKVSSYARQKGHPLKPVVEAVE